MVIDPVRNDAGELIGFAKITRDITERRLAAQQLENMQRQLAESQKMDALGQLTGGVAHDFNNLLMAVTGNARLIKRHAIDPRVVKAAEAIEASVRRGAALTRQLLTLRGANKSTRCCLTLERLCKLYAKSWPQS